MKEQEKGGARPDPEGAQERTDDAHFAEMPSSSSTTPEATELPSQSAPRATGLPTHPGTWFATATKHPATRPATSSLTTTAPIAGGAGLTGPSDPEYGVDTRVTVPPMAHPVNEPVSSGFCYTSIHEPTPCEYPDVFPGVPTAAPLPTIPAHTTPEHGLGFTFLGDLPGPGSCGGRSREFGRSLQRSLTR